MHNREMKKSLTHKQWELYKIAVKYDDKSEIKHWERVVRSRQTKKNA